MSPAAQRIAIAEACGITVQDTTAEGTPFHSLPDYLNDLNAMLGAENALTAEQQINYARCLRQNHSQRHFLHQDFDLIHATAAQRAEAFLRTLGRWHEPI